MGTLTCSECGGRFDEAEVTLDYICVACDAARQEKVLKEQMGRLPIALVAGALAFLAFPIAIFFKGPNASGYYVGTSRGRGPALFSLEAIVGFIILGLVFVGASAFFYFKSKNTAGNDESLSIFSDESSTRTSADE